MVAKKSTSRLINEMTERMLGLHRCGVISTIELEQFIGCVKEKSEYPGGFEAVKAEESER